MAEDKPKKKLTRKQREELAALLEERERRRNILKWVEGKVNENNVKVTLDKHEFQKAIWQDFSETLYVRKAAQIGVSTIFIFKCLYLLERFGYNIIYTLPTLMNDVQKFVPSKVDPIIRANGFQMTRDTVTQKQLGNGFWFFGGTMSEKEGIMTTGDLTVHDEVDRSNLEVIGTYKSRLGHSQYRRRWFFSNPSAPKRGVDAGWLASDQKHWFLKCECGLGNFGGWQFLDWPANVDYANKRYICIYCGREITDEDRRKGEWVQKYPSRDISGYWVSQMMAPWIPCSSLIVDEINESTQYFYNFVLGIPWLGTDVSINRDMVLKNLSDEKPDTVDVFMGVDVGAVLHVVIGNRTGIFKVCTTDWDSLEGFMNLYDCRQVVIDAMPETTKAKEFRAKYPHRVKLCYYRPPTTRMPGSQDIFTVKYEEQTISAMRTEVIDRVIDEFTQNRMRIYIDPKETVLTGGGGRKKGDSFVEHWENMYLYHDEEKGYKTWEHSGPDHFAHATVYFWLARQLGHAGMKHKVVIK